MSRSNIFPSSNERRITGVLVAFSSGLLLGLFASNIEEPLQVLFPALSTLIAAFLGAWFAFRLHRIKDQEDEKNRNMVAGNKAIFTMSRIYNELYTIKEQIIDPVRQSPWNFITMQPTLELRYRDLSFDISELCFLLETKYRNILGEVAMFESRFQKTIDAFNERSRLHLSEVQPLMEKGGIHIGGEYTRKQIQDALGERLYISMEKSTENIIKYIDEDLDDAYKTSDKLHAALKNIFPRSDFIKINNPA